MPRCQGPAYVKAREELKRRTWAQREDTRAILERRRQLTDSFWVGKSREELNAAAKAHPFDPRLTIRRDDADW